MQSPAIEDYIGLENTRVFFAVDGIFYLVEITSLEDSKAINMNDFNFAESVSGRHRRSDRGFKQRQFLQPNFLLNYF